jgi:1-phosphofructokinase
VIAQTLPGAFTRHESDDLYNLFLSSALGASAAVLTGPVHENMLDPSIYRRLARDLANNDVPVIADVSGKFLRALGPGTRIVKAAHDELIDAGYCRANEMRDLASGVRGLQSQGVEDVVCSRAAEPALASVGGRFFELEPPAVEPVDETGAGDSMTAALAAGLANGMPTESMLRLAVAAATLNVTRHGLGSGHAGSIQRLADLVKIRERPDLRRH